VFKTYAHLGEDGKKKVTTETTEDISPILSNLKDVAQNRNAKSELRLKASIPFTIIDDAAKKYSQIWGVSVVEAFREITTVPTDRGQKVLKLLTEDMDYKKLQARNY